MQVTGMFRRWMTVMVVALVVGSYASTARADIVIGEKDGWNANFNGFLNLFLVDTFGQAAPTAPHAPDVWSAPTDNNVFRVRTGFLPAVFGFNANAPEWQGIKTALRVASTCSSTTSTPGRRRPAATRTPLSSTGASSTSR